MGNAEYMGAERRLEVCVDDARKAAAHAEDRHNAQEARMAEAQELLAALRSRLDEALSMVSESKESTISLEGQLEQVLETSEYHKRAHAELEQSMAELQQELTMAQQDATTLAAQRAVLEQANGKMQEQLLATQQEHAALRDAHCTVCANLAERCKEVKLHSDIAGGLQAEVQQLTFSVENHKARLKAYEAHSAAEREARRERDETIEEELQEAARAVRAEGKAISSFLAKFPATEALLVLFRHLLSFVAGSAECAIRKRLSLHNPAIVCKHELEQFFADDLGIRGHSLRTVTQALFGALDLERNGYILKNMLCDRLQRPPTMKTVWRTELKALWPDRWQEMSRGWSSESRSPSPPASPQKGSYFNEPPLPRATSPQASMLLGRQLACRSKPSTPGRSTTPVAPDSPQRPRSAYGRRPVRSVVKSPT